MSKEWSNGICGCFGDITVCKFCNFSRIVSVNCVFFYNRLTVLFRSMRCVWTECWKARRELRYVRSQPGRASAKSVLQNFSQRQNQRAKRNRGLVLQGSPLRALLSNVRTGTRSSGKVAHLCISLVTCYTTHCYRNLGPEANPWQENEPTRPEALFLNYFFVLCMHFFLFLRKWT